MSQVVIQLDDCRVASYCKQSAYSAKTDLTKSGLGEVCGGRNLRPLTRPFRRRSDICAAPYGNTREMKNASTAILGASRGNIRAGEYACSKEEKWTF